MVVISLILWIIILINLYIISNINNESILIKDFNDQYYLNIFIFLFKIIIMKYIYLIQIKFLIVKFYFYPNNVNNFSISNTTN